LNPSLFEPFAFPNPLYWLIEVIFDNILGKV